MAEPFLSEIRIFSFNFPPKGWAFCNGQLLPINQNQALFALLGTTYGGNGQTNFALPNLQGQVPIHTGSGHTLGERAGASSVTVTAQQLPQHIHFASGVSDVADSQTPVGNYLASVDTAVFEAVYAAPQNLVAMAPEAVANMGGSQAHTNMMPYLVLNFCIALQGIFPLTELTETPMAQPYIGEIRMFAGNFPPLGWEFCDGQSVPISENETLFQLIGTTYGGDGESTFNLPNLQSRIPLHMGNGPDGISYPLAEQAGTESVTLTVQQMPVHTHAMLATSSAGSETTPNGNLTGTPLTKRIYTTATAPAAMHAAVTPAGGSQPHENSQPFLCINYIISMFGIFPSPT